MKNLFRFVLKQFVQNYTFYCIGVLRKFKFIRKNTIVVTLFKANGQRKTLITSESVVILQRLGLDTSEVQYLSTVPKCYQWSNMSCPLCQDRQVTLFLYSVSICLHSPKFQIQYRHPIFVR
jgi:hypothetical protein